MNIVQFLQSSGAHFSVHEHPVTYSSQQLAAAEHVSGHAVAKGVVVQTDQAPILCVLPASYQVDLPRLGRAIHAKGCHLATERDLARIFPDVEVGAEPPFGKPYGLRTVVDQHLADCATVTFNAGTHDHAIQMPFDEYAKLAEAEVVDFCTRS